MTSIQLVRAAMLVCAGLLTIPAVAAGLDTAAIERLTGLKGALNDKEGVFKVNFPRKDIAARITGVKMIPDLGLTAWAAFTDAGEHTMVMGDIVVLENEVNPVMSAALDSGLEVTALHNHFSGRHHGSCSCTSVARVTRHPSRAPWAACSTN